MAIKQLSRTLSVAPQLMPADVAGLGAMGFRAILCNRPDGEAPDQPSAAEIGAAARAAGLGFAYVPAVAGALTDADVAAMRAALDSLPGPVLAYCRSGARAEKLAEMAGILLAKHAAHYDVLVVCPGIVLDWDAIPGLSDALGHDGLTSNYRYDLAPYTNRLVKHFKGGRALFTQPPMPIKCAGAPQKAMYLSCHRWEKSGVLAQSDVQFHTAGAVLFGVPAYVPALMDYVDRYGIKLNFGSKLVEIDGAAKTAIFEQADGQGVKRVAARFDMIHVVPPQIAPDFVRTSPLASASGFVEVDEATLRHPRYPDIFALGDACSTSNAKTMAAARKQAPVVAVNALAALDGQAPVATYDGYGSCPLTVEAGKIVLAEFGYGGKLMPSFPNWLIDGTRPSRLSWLLKDTILPPVYWHGMLKGREWMVKPQMIGARP
ncbi:FIG003847: Oxidoreductase (flavoprotein) [Sphingobium indicum BiD32]|uniref:FIG003847: Oxidoreductase (Flavoprotein) n=1 Tax=Sphingobium indicum BiD32 TaxID=1301087 RepID=N1MQX7_9SPHN|nr:bifunctional protein tyrosine phosphatase family protein/NAD(P)/FAD-dependent oxidoreductase [Sphingobium indicum]CCW18067.1 FIG003847: Oxidoreductase (flavoprotein) [Sphingobium indicum BiD32]